MKNSFLILVFFGVLVLANAQNPKHTKLLNGDVWITTGNQKLLLQKNNLTNKHNDDSVLPIIDIDADEKYQAIDGFGYTLTGGSARLINEMDVNHRDSLLTQLFAFNNENIGTSYLRISIGASDLSDSVFTYNDIPIGETDVELNAFSIQPELKHLIPVLIAIKKISPEIGIMGSPWSAPAWMKDNQKMIGGSLKPEYYPVYANYLVKYVMAMAKHGIKIDAITVQNEPLHPGNNPSMYMTAEAQAEFVKKHLGPAFVKNNIDTKIIIYDHNADKPEYPISILNDAEAKKYIDGSAFHLYGGEVNAISRVHEAHPDRNLYFTEQWIGGPANFSGDLFWHIENLIIGASRNWCKTVLEWNLAADSKYDPHTDQGGCTRCLGAITIDGNSVTLNPAYYIIGHASKFVRPGSYRISSNILPNLSNVAFQTPDKKIVLIVLNKMKESQKFVVKIGDRQITTEMPMEAVASFVFEE